MDCGAPWGLSVTSSIHPSDQILREIRSYKKKPVEIEITSLLTIYDVIFRNYSNATNSHQTVLKMCETEIRTATENGRCRL